LTAYFISEQNYINDRFENSKLSSTYVKNYLLFAYLLNINPSALPMGILINELVISCMIVLLKMDEVVLSIAIKNQYLKLNCCQR
jgi:hypothetical protein